MEKELNYLSSKRWEKVGHQELHSAPYKQEIDPRTAQSSGSRLKLEIIF
jgi:hypothetical protein